MLNELGDLQLDPEQRIQAADSLQAAPLGDLLSPVPTSHGALYTFGLRLLESLADGVYGVTGFLFLAFWVLLGTTIYLLWVRYGSSF